MTQLYSTVPVTVPVTDPCPGSTAGHQPIRVVDVGTPRDTYECLHCAKPLPVDLASRAAA